MPGSHVPENEGQHIQNVYPSGRKTGGQIRYAFNAKSHMTEQSEYVSDENRRAIFNAWAKYWDTRRPMLLEKSPPHTLKMRFFQHLFTRQRTRFIMTIRHPLGYAHFHYTKTTKKGNLKKDCGARYIEHWLSVYRIALQDMPALESIAVVQFEDFLAHGKDVAQGYVAELERFLQLNPEIQLHEYPEAEQGRQDYGSKRRSKRKKKPLSPTATTSGGSSSRTGGDGGGHNQPQQQQPQQQQPQQQQPQQQQQPHQKEMALTDLLEDEPFDVFQRSRRMPSGEGSWGGRKLLEYHGSRTAVAVRFSSTLGWVDDFLNLVDYQSETCQRMIEFYEEQVNQFGYSLRNLTHVTEPKLLHPYLLKVEALSLK